MARKCMGKIKSILGFVTFCCIVFYFIRGITYLLRENQYNYNDRISVVGLKEEDRNSLDVIYIGGSAAFVYWEPLKAYRDYGFASYDLATNSIQAEAILAYIKYAQKFQDPDLYVIDTRAFQYYSKQGNEVGLRVSADALDIGLNRMELVHEYLKNRELDTDEMALYWDLAKYHTNYEALSKQSAWRLIDNSEVCDYKGCQIQNAWCYLEQPERFQTEKRARLIPENEKTLTELLNYCKKNQIDLLFTVCPYFISESDYEIYNSIEDIVTSFGYGFINTNDYYEEMGIDFACDFYNTDHVNSIGAEKYTAFLGKYMVDHYALKDHRSDDKYSGWEQLSLKFLDEAEESRSEVLDTIAYAREGLELGKNLSMTDEFIEWANLANDSRYSIIAVGNGQTLSDLNYRDKKLIERFGLSDVIGRKRCIRILNGDEVLDSNIDGREMIVVSIGQIQRTVQCIADTTDQENSICIDGVEYSLQSQKGVNVVVFDNYYRTVIDSVVLSGIHGNVQIFR